MASTEERLHSEPTCWLATTRRDGRPHLTPIWFVFADHRFWMCTMPTAVKARTLAHNPFVSVSLPDGAAPVVAEGRARIVDRDAWPQQVIDAFRAKFDWDIATDPDGYTTLIEVTVDRWLMGRP